ncbi:MAG: 8-amino-7-oxononanoate synthase [Streptosporangiaceae bacterium]
MRRGTIGGTRLATLRQALDRRERGGLRRVLAPRARGDATLDLASNDYLGLARDPRVIEGACRAARDWGAGATGSRLVTGSTTLHAELEERLADTAAAPSALVFSSGYLANLAAVTALTGRDTLVVSDAANHASIIDACHLSRARVVVTPHRDAAAVEGALAARAEEDALVVTDAVFSVEGDLAPLPELHAACRRHGAVLLIDEAHAFGVVGKGGRGATYAAGLAGERDIVRTVTLSKSLGGQGGAVLGDDSVVDTLVDTARSFIFDTGLAPPCVGAALAALDLLAAEPERPERARTRAAQLAAGARTHGLSATAPDAAVTAIVLGPPQTAVAYARACERRGIRVGCFRPPSVPEGRSCLRLTASATLSEGDAAHVVATLAGVRSAAS